MPSFDEKPLTSSPARDNSATSSSDHLPRSPVPHTINNAAEKEAGPTPSNHDFDPCQAANPCSPFYNHDTPRGSMDNHNKSKLSFHVCVRDLEGQHGLTPSQTPDTRPSPVDGGTLKPWTTSTSMFGREKSRCLTKPRQRGCDCMSSLPKRQKLLVKMLIALVIIGAMVGIGVGISIRVGGRVYKDQNSTSKIGTV